jgi:hypothetical protein
MFALLKAADWNLLIQGGQLYRAILRFLRIFGRFTLFMPFTDFTHFLQDLHFLRNVLQKSVISFTPLWILRPAIIFTMLSADKIFHEKA